MVNGSELKSRYSDLWLLKAASHCRSHLPIHTHSLAHSHTDAWSLYVSGSTASTNALTPFHTHLLTTDAAVWATWCLASGHIIMWVLQWNLNLQPSSYQPSALSDCTTEAQISRPKQKDCGAPWPLTHYLSNVIRLFSNQSRHYRWVINWNSVLITNKNRILSVRWL